MMGWAVRRVRDLTIMDASDGSTIVIACDSVGGLGDKPGDTFAADPRTVTHFGARVPILEVLAAGAVPQVIVDTLSVEKDPAAKPMIAEIRALAEELGLDPEVAVTGSTEDNVPTTATGLGVTVIGVAPPGGLRLGTTRADDTIVCVGVPLSAPRDLLVPGDPRMPGIAEVAALVQLPGVHEALPVGSKGVWHEARELARTSGLTLEAIATELDLEFTAGPSSCVLLSIDPGELAAVLGAMRPNLPVAVIATAAVP